MWAHQQHWSSSGDLASKQQQQLAMANASEGTQPARPASPSTTDSALGLLALPSTETFPTPAALAPTAHGWSSAGPSSSSQPAPAGLQVPNVLERAVSSLAQELAALAATSNSPSAPGAFSLQDNLGLDLGGLTTHSSFSAKSLQPKLLKQINSLTTKEEILNYIQHCHHLLDSINLVTCLYRLARIYSFTQSVEQKAIWKAELINHPAFTLLLSVVHGHLARAHAILATHSTEVPGLNARCMSNLVWSIVKLEVVGVDDGHPLALDVAMASVPLVLCFIKDCSGQGLANLLWSFVKIPSSPPQVITAIVERMVELLEQPSSSATLDAQALSNTIWAIAHIRSAPCEALDNSPQWNNAVTSFLLLMANQCMLLLTSAVETSGPQRRGPGSQGMGGGGMGMGNQGNDGRFSCQAIVNIVWSFSTILGSACGVQAPMRPLFLVIRQLAVARLQVMLSGNSAYQPLALGLTGNFNEQALSNLVFAYNKAGLLSPELLQSVFDVAAIRLGRTSAGSSGPLGFKPQELCTLLRACHLGVAQPWTFLHALSRVMAQFPTLTQGWTSTELAELHQALQLLRSAMPAVQQAPHVQQQQAHVLGGLPHHLSAGNNNHNGAMLMMDPRPRQQIELAGGGFAGGLPASHGIALPSGSTVSLESTSAASLQPSMGYSGPMGGYGGMPGASTHMRPGMGPQAGSYHHMQGGAVGMPSRYQPQPMMQQQQQDASQLQGTLQQVWVVDASGNLQQTTVLLPAGVNLQQSLQHLSLGGSGNHSNHLARAPLAGSGGSLNVAHLAGSGESMNLGPLARSGGSLNMAPLMGSGGSANLASLTLQSPQ